MQEVGIPGTERPRLEPPRRSLPGRSASTWQLGKSSTPDAFARSPPKRQWVPILSSGFNLTFNIPERLGYTISLTADDAKVTLQFQYMKAPPFDTIEARKRLYDAVAAISGVNVEERLTGRPSFPMAALAVGENLEQFVRILDDAVDQMLKSHDAQVCRRAR